MSSRTELISFYISRIAMVLLCVGMIVGFLYLPYMSRFRPKERSITFYTWAEIFDLNDIVEFEKQSGITVNLIYYDNCEELVTKLELSKGRGYDLLLLADCNLSDLIRMDMLMPFDKTKLNFMDDLEPLLLNRPYDPNNFYSVPYSWDVYGLGINTAKFKDTSPSDSWGMIFDAHVAAPKIGMVDDGLSAFVIASQYLYGNTARLNQEQIARIKQLLTQQKQLVEVYTGTRGDYLLSSGSSPVVASQAACVQRAMWDDEKIKFVVPQEGGFVSTECFAILKNSPKADLIYEFLNYMYRAEVVRKFVDKTMYLPTRKDILAERDLGYLGGKEHLLDPAYFEKLALFKYVIPREEICRLWVEVKAS